MNSLASRLRMIGAMAALALAASPVAAATLQNGMFSDGFDGYDVRRCSFVCGADGTHSAAVVPGAGSDPYLELKAPSYIFGAGQIEVFQSVDITAGASQLSFDAGLLSGGKDIAPKSQSSITDYLTLLLGTSSKLYSLFTYDTGGAQEAASNTLTDILSIAPKTIANMPGALSAYAFGADLSQFIGEEVTLYFITVSKDDEAVTTFGIDNIALNGKPVTPASPVPLPAGGALVLTALGALVGFRKCATRA